jgi:predicted small metal-binding protein
MSGFYLVCKKRSNGSKCTETISADTKEDLLTAAMQHASSAHGIPETRGLKDEYRSRIKKNKAAV